MRLILHSAIEGEEQLCAYIQQMLHNRDYIQRCSIKNLWTGSNEIRSKSFESEELMTIRMMNAALPNYIISRYIFVGHEPISNAELDKQTVRWEIV